MPPPVEMQQKYLSEVEATYAFLEENFDALYERCAAPADRQLLRSLHAAGRDAYWRAVASALRDGNQIVHEIYSDLLAVNQQLRDQLASLQNVGALLALARQAVRLAGSLVTLAAA
jgi:hypothetical protein